MFYPNTLNLKNVSFKTKKLAAFDEMNSDMDENLLPLTASPLCYNFDYSNGALKDGIGIHKLKFRSSEIYEDAFNVIDLPIDGSYYLGCWLFVSWAPEISIYRSFVILYTSYGEFYYSRIHSANNELVKIEGLNFKEKPMVASCRIDGVDTLILVSNKDGMYTWQFPNYLKKIENAPSISSMCIYNNRLFVITNGERRRVFFSEDLNLINFNLSVGNSGYIEVADDFGKCNKILSFQGYLYVFKDFNIAKIVEYSDNNDFAVNQLYMSDGRIFEKTICVCGDKVYYLASDGIYVFNGTKAKKIDLKINNLFKNKDNSNAVAGYSNGYYYLSCNLNFNDGLLVGKENGNEKNNALLRIDVSTQEMTILRGFDIRELFVINDILKNEICALVYEPSGYFSLGVVDQSGKYFENSIKKVWNLPYTDLGYPGRNKVIKEIYFETAKDIVLEIRTEKQNKKCHIKGMPIGQKIRPLIKGKKFTIAIVSYENDNYITNPQITIGVL